MAQRRISRGTPLMLTTHQQRAWIATVDDDPEMQRTLSELIGKPWADMGEGHRILAIEAYLEKGYGAAAMAGASRAIDDLHNRTKSHQANGELADRVIVLEARIAELIEERDRQAATILAQGEQIDELTKRPVTGRTATRRAPRRAGTRS
jgi:hypothetical protein